ncbi:MAG: hypothetical protein KDA95_03580 [Acidimicrobiales bacterium]|nr:hypothetical protein [Acidimicrobiales bacterium]
MKHPPVPRGSKRVVLVLLAAVSLIGFGCSSDDSNTTSTEKPTSTTSAGGTEPSTTASASSTKAFVDIQECENLSGTGSASGTITNNGDDATAFKYVVGFYDSSDKELATAEVVTYEAEPGADAAWAVTVDGLGDISSDDLTCKTVSIEATSERPGGSDDEKANQDEEFPCSLFTADEIAQITGNPLDGDMSSGPVTENEFTYEAKRCTWSVSEFDEEAQEVILTVSLPEDFPSGTFVCPSALGGETPLSVTGTESNWMWVDPGTTAKVGTLRSCGDEVFVSVEVSGANNEAQQQQVAVAVVEHVLDEL